MTLVAGESFEEDLPDDFEMKLAPAEPQPMALFRFPDVIYTREPSTGYVLEIRNENDTTRTRVFAADGSERPEFQLPSGDPQWN